MEFDKLISNGQLTKAARLFAKEYYDSGRMGNTRRLLIERLADKCDKYDAEIARQSVKSEDVTEAIDLLKEIQHDKYVVQNHTENDVKNYELISFAITALQKMQGWIPVSEGLPDQCESYLVVVKEKDQPHDLIHVDVASSHGEYIDDFWDTFNDWKEGQEVHITHWKPLPEPPKGE